MSNYTWKNFNADVRKMSMFWLDKRPENGIITGIPRGGLPLAVSLSHALKIPYVNMSNCNLGEVQSDEKTIIVAEDILDTGTAFERNVKYLQFFDWKSIIYVFLHAKEKWNLKENKFNLLNKCQVYVANPNVPEQDWIVYEWEDLHT